jgi:hypothetical protein
MAKTLNFEQELLKLVRCNTKFMERVSQTLEAINDSNVLHKKAIDENTSATREMAKSFSRVWYILLLVICALIVLAGAEKVFRFIKI